MKNKVSISLMIILCAFVSLQAQVAGNPPYTMEQAVIASGGGQSSAGGNFSIDGTIGQAVAGTNSTNSPFAVQGGFWTAAPLAPTSASVTVSGRVLVDNRRGLRNARVVITDGRGSPRIATTSAFGYFRFNDVAAGETYIFTVQSKSYIFAPQVLFVGEDINEIVFNAVSQNPLGQKPQ